MTDTNTLTKLELYRRDLNLQVTDGNIDDTEADERFFTEVNRVSTIEDWEDFQNSGGADVAWEGKSNEQNNRIRPSKTVSSQHEEEWQVHFSQEVLPQGGEETSQQEQLVLC